MGVGGYNAFPNQIFLICRVLQTPYQWPSLCFGQIRIENLNAVVSGEPSNIPLLLFRACVLDSYNLKPSPSIGDIHCKFTIKMAEADWDEVTYLRKKTPKAAEMRSKQVFFTAFV